MRELLFTTTYEINTGSESNVFCGTCGWRKRSGRCCMFNIRVHGVRLPECLKAERLAACVPVEERVEKP